MRDIRATRQGETLLLERQFQLSMLLSQQPQPGRAENRPAILERRRRSVHLVRALHTGRGRRTDGCRPPFERTTLSDFDEILCDEPRPACGEKKLGQVA